MLAANGILKDYRLAEDCVQVTFIKAGLNYESVIQKNNIYPWIRKILVNECKSLLRTKWIKVVAKSLKIKEITCRVRLHRGRNLLREYMIRERATDRERVECKELEVKSKEFKVERLKQV
jgi:DNA-directed RNA polymerase specialized sigma24 family protein